MNPFISKLNIEKLNVGELAIFCGAGISKNSGIPTVIPFLQHMYSTLGLPENEQQMLISTKQPFEKIIETMLSVNEQLVRDMLFNSFDNIVLGLKPTGIHKWLAELAKKKLVSAIFTTNFDTLIEDALNAAGVSFMTHCTDQEGSICCDENCKSYQVVNWSSKILKVIKIHGCIRCRDEMAITIKNIASQRKLASRTKCISEFFTTKGNHLKILLMGYSASDIFDIVPVLEKVRRTDKSIFYLNHGMLSAFDKLNNVKSVRNVDEDFNPFKNWGDEHFWMTFNTNLLVADDSVVDGSNKFKWKKWANRYVRELPKGEKEFLSAKLFRIGSPTRGTLTEKNALEISLKYYSQSQKIYEILNNMIGLANCYNNMANILKDMGKLKGSLELHKKASKLFKNQGEHMKLAWSYGNQANIHRRLGNHIQAMRFHKKALKFFKDMGHMESVSKSYGNIALVHKDKKDYRLSISYHQKEARICNKIGDLEGLAKSFYNQANVLIFLREHDQALHLFDKAIKIFNDTKNLPELSSCLIYKGILFQKMGQLESALELYKEGEKISLEYNDPYNLTITYYMQSSLLKDLGNEEDAESLLLKSLKLIDDHGFTHLLNELNF